MNRLRGGDLCDLRWDEGIKRKKMETTFTMGLLREQRAKQLWEPQDVGQKWGSVKQWFCC